MDRTRLCCHTPVQDTNDSSTVSKVSASRKGYFVDPFIEKLCPVRANRSPLINRGYYIRSKAVHQKLVTFLQETKDDNARQVLSLGAGFDTSYFRLCHAGLTRSLKYVEVDFPRVVQRKAERLHACDYFEPFLTESSFRDGIFSSSDYFIIGCDITDLRTLQEKLVRCKFDCAVPTLILAECVLTYIAPQKVDAIIQWFSSYLLKSVICAYEQVFPDDGFGLIMQSHFMKLSSPLLNLQEYGTPEKMKQRYINLGWHASKCCDMNHYYNWLPLAEKVRVENLEPFDEYEEFELKCRHYIMLCASTASLASLLDQMLPCSSVKCQLLPTQFECRIEELEKSTDSATVSRYAHSSVSMGDDLVVIGGYGSSNHSCHQRLDDVLLLNFSQTLITTNSLSLTGSGPGPIVHHKAVLLCDRKVLVIGGRSSPHRPSDGLYTLTITGTTGEWKRVRISVDSDEMEPRWRHSATVIQYQGVECVLVVGGRCLSTVYDDCYIIDTRSWSVIKLQICLPEGRHSHAAIKAGDDVLIVGGLGLDLQHVSTCLRLRHNCVSGCWSCHSFHLALPTINTRYSMCSCEVSLDEVYILGGIGSDLNVYLTKLHLKEMSTVTCNLTKITSGIKLLHYGLSLHFIKEQLVLVGGGGNCFSFGTHFNATYILTHK